MSVVLANTEFDGKSPLLLRAHVSKIKGLESCRGRAGRPPGSNHRGSEQCEHFWSNCGLSLQNSYSYGPAGDLTYAPRIILIHYVFISLVPRSTTINETADRTYLPLQTHRMTQKAWQYSCHFVVIMTNAYIAGTNRVVVISNIYTALQAREQATHMGISS